MRDVHYRKSNGSEEGCCLLWFEVTHELVVTRAQAEHFFTQVATLAHLGDFVSDAKLAAYARRVLAKARPRLERVFTQNVAPLDIPPDRVMTLVCAIKEIAKELRLSRNHLILAPVAASANAICQGMDVRVRAHRAILLEASDAPKGTAAKVLLSITGATDYASAKQLLFDDIQATTALIEACHEVIQCCQK